MPARTNTPTILIILGITGDLAKKKILPALEHLAGIGVLPERFEVVGFSRRPWQDEDLRDYVSSMLPSAKPEFLEKLSYVQGTFENDASYEALATRLREIDDRWGVRSNKLFYLAVPPNVYEPILNHLSSSGLTEPYGEPEGWTRVLVEKPLGNDAQSAADLDKMLSRLFKEEQIYRIDHYLAKEMLQNVLIFRFTNDLFQSIWNKEHIERIEMRTLETMGVEERGPFYDAVGTLRDVGQNHLLQMIALMAMDYPERFESAMIRAKRAAILNKLLPPTPEEVRKETFRAQYAGYRDIKGVRPDSDTETYFRAVARLDHPLWQGVPIYLEAGKRLGEAKKEIVAVIRHASPCLCPRGEPHYEDRLIIRFEPREEILVQFWIKRPGLDFALEERTMEFHLRKDGERRAQYTEEYEKLLLDCIAGDQTLFVSSAEVAPMWRYTDAIRREWDKGAVPLHIYQPGTNDVLGQAHAVVSAAKPASAERKIVGIAGLGKMGANIARHLLEQDWEVVAWNRSPEAAERLAAEGARAVQSLAELAAELPSPRTIWVMVPAGEAVDEVLFGKQGIVRHLAKGDVVIDGGNSFYKDSKRRAARLARRGISFLDAGTSGGPAGARQGATLMVGGEEKAYNRLEPLFRDIAAKDAVGHFGPAGAGHFVKMVHNGIEYGMMQAIAEGFGIMKRSPFRLPLRKIAELYNHRSVIESRLVGWLAKAFTEQGEDLADVSGTVGYTGEGEWTAAAAKELKVPAPIIEGSFKFRVASRKRPSYLGKILSALRNQFGGHDMGKK